MHFSPPSLPPPALLIYLLPFFSSLPSLLSTPSPFLPPSAPPLFHYSFFLLIPPPSFYSLPLSPFFCLSSFSLFPLSPHPSSLFLLPSPASFLLLLLFFITPFSLSPSPSLPPPSSLPPSPSLPLSIRRMSDYVQNCPSSKSTPRRP